jgi:hypothetical protein
MHRKPPQRFHPTYGLVSGLRELQAEAPIIAPTTGSAACGYNRWDLKLVIRWTTRLIEAPNKRFANNLDAIDWLQQGRVVPHKARRSSLLRYATGHARTGGYVLSSEASTCARNQHSLANKNAA